MATAWKEVPQYNYGDGLYLVTSNTDPKFPDSALFQAMNIVYVKDSADPSAMYGASRLGSTDIGGTVSGLFDYNNGDKLVATAEDGKVWEYGADWAASSGARATGNTTTAGIRWSGVMFYGSTTAKNLLILANGVDAPIKYDTANGAVALGGSSPSTGNYPVVWQGRLWLFAGDIAYYSAPDNAEDFTTAGGGGQVAIYRGQDGDITGAAFFGDSLFIFKRSTLYRIGPGQISNNAVKNIDTSVGTVSHHTIQRIGGSDANKMVWWSEHGIEAIEPTDVSVGFTTRNIGRWVQPILDRRNTDEMAKAWALYNLPRMEYFTSFPSGTGTIPKESVIGNFGKGSTRPRWTRADKLNLTAGVTFNTSNTGYDQYVADSGGKVYKMHDTSVEDWDGVAFTKTLQTKYSTHQAPNRMKKFGWSYVRAVGSTGGTITVRQRLLRQGMNGLAAQNNSTLQGTADGWGVGEWGVAQWGGSGTAGERIRPDGARRAFGMSHVITTQNQFTLSGIVTASVVRSNKTA